MALTFHPSTCQAHNMQSKKQAQNKIKLTDEQIELAARLTPLQRKFVLELIKPKMTQRKAYVNAGGTSKCAETQDATASRMIRNDKVAAFHNSLINSIASDLIMDKQEALEILSRSARVTVTDICDFTLENVGEDEEGNPIFQTVWKMKHSDEIDPKVLEAIKSVTFTKTGPKIELYDRNGSIKILSDMQGWNAPRKQELAGVDGKPIAIKSDIDISAPEIASALQSVFSKL